MSWCLLCCGKAGSRHDAPSDAPPSPAPRSPLLPTRRLAAVFKASDPELDVLSPRLLFVAIQFGGLLFTMYKLNGMGLLPTHASDWYDTTVPPVLEFSSGGALVA